MSEQTAVVTYEERIGALSVGDVRSQVNLIQQVMREVMIGPTKDDPLGVHYGVIPGTGKKPTLLKAGAEKLCLTFRLDPEYETVETKDGAHLTVVSKCTLFHIPSGQRYGSGMGSCSTKESKYAYRVGKRKCPKCGAEAINRSKYPPKDQPSAEPGWYCHAKQGGCGRQFAADDKGILNQQIGRMLNEDLADQYGTVLKMANKRSLVAAVLNVTAASDIFTQDVEDMQPIDREPEVIDRSTGEIKQPSKPRAAQPQPAQQVTDALPAYPAAKFAENLPKWANLIAAGNKTPEQIIATISSKAQLSAPQRIEIMALKPEPPVNDAIDAEFVRDFESNEGI